MNPKISALFIGLITLACFVAGALVYAQLPSIVATHWNLAGQPDGYSSRFWGVFVFPFIILVLDLVWYVLPNIDPIRKGFTGFRHVYDFFWILLTAFFAALYALTLLADLGFPQDLSVVLPLMLGLLFICLGALLPHVKRNWFFGIRTPWTLSSERVWDKTQHLGGGLIMLAGAITVVGTFFNEGTVVWLVLAPILVAALISVVYSYVLFRREH